MADPDKETVRAIEFFVRDNISLVVAELFSDRTDIEQLRLWLQTEAQSAVADAKRRRIVELADALDLEDSTSVGDIRAEVTTVPAPE